MVAIIVIGASLAAFNFCSTLLSVQEEKFNCLILEPKHELAPDLKKFLDTHVDVYMRESAFINVANVPLRSSKGHFTNPKAIESLIKVLLRNKRKNSNAFNQTVGDLINESFHHNTKYSKELLDFINRQLCIRNCKFSMHEIFPEDVQEFDLSDQWHNHTERSTHNERNYNLFVKNVLFDKQVKLIEYSGNNVTIECTDGTKYQAPFVFFAQSLGVLKHFHKSWFKPPLSQRKINAIQGYCITSTNRITLTFGSNLPKSAGDRNFLWSKEHYEQTKIKAVKWILGIPGLYTNHIRKDQLIGYNTGFYSKQMEYLNFEQLLNGFETLLKIFYPNLPCLLNVEISKVNTDPHIRGGTPFDCTHVKIFEATRKDLAAPAFNINGYKVCKFVIL